MINRWHNYLDMKHYDQAWHENDINDELEEYKAETKLMKRWSEMSDVVYTYTRSKWDNCPVEFPLGRRHYYAGLIYMFPKYTLRWWFYRAAGRKAGAKKDIHEVRNPRKIHKLVTIAERSKLDPAVFSEICKKQLKYWILLP